MIVIFILRYWRSSAWWWNASMVLLILLLLLLLILLLLRNIVVIWHQYLGIWITSIITLLCINTLRLSWKWLSLWSYLLWQHRCLHLRWLLSSWRIWIYFLLQRINLILYLLLLQVQIFSYITSLPHCWNPCVTRYSRQFWEFGLVQRWRSRVWKSFFDLGDLGKVIFNLLLLLRKS